MFYSSVEYKIFIKLLMSRKPYFQADGFYDYMVIFLRMAGFSIKFSVALLQDIDDIHDKTHYTV